MAGCRLLVARRRRDHVLGKHRRGCVVHHGVRVLDPDPVGAVVGLHDVHDGVVRVLLGPIALELEHDLQRRDRLRDWAEKDTYDAVMDIVKTHYGAYGIGVEYVYTMVHKAPPTVFPEYVVPSAANHR